MISPADVADQPDGEIVDQITQHHRTNDDSILSTSFDEGNNLLVLQNVTIKLVELEFTVRADRKIIQKIMKNRSVFY